MFIIENENFLVKVKTRGAELCSLVRKADEKEYIWQADPKYWKRHAPTLFPVVGTLNPLRNLNMGRHGFARDMDFVSVDKSEDSICLELVSNKESLSVYPYDFRLLLTYKLEGSVLSIGYSVENKGTDLMPFSIGAHPAFLCDLMGEKTLLEFEKEEGLDCLTLDLKKGLLDGGKYPIALENRKLSLTPKTFEKDALVFKNLNSTWIGLIDQTNQTEVKVHFQGFPYMGIWSSGGPFVCIEPWYGVTDSINDSGPLTEKEGIIKLMPGESFTAQHKIEVVR